MVASSPELFRLYPDALRDSHIALYSLLVLAPLTSLVSNVLLYRGKKTSPSQVYILSLVVPALAMWSLMWYLPQEQNVYRLLTMSRAESHYQWAQKYTFFRKHYQTGNLSPEAWHSIDTAYDSIYNDRSRYLYDFWGPGQEKMTTTETMINVGLFYVLWSAIVYAVTTPKASQAASKMSYVVLAILLSIEMTIRMTNYDPIIKEISPYTTPRESILWGHWIFPILVFARVSVTKVFYIDLDKHQERVLVRMVETNVETMKELLALDDELSSEREITSETKKEK
ncbi:uncharacterized protein PHALS_07873 [Plasmopara halstedii]|uniref:Uncharacterized protein n=1 Tax=Plasmopara halstedii TaxID=4781 RepID=A0A0P1B5M9_PLAHL|nr:uncharacterized protein PHALS_07873 [Plasmopara halstedii]CEG50148.1 hypothetical protein PHALS_07873 [Plasmopara halstedii]|eukprot:XP_024586517.1 hypothetical protein PHALS_07873 [Plasmopara halstedii]